MGLIEGDTRSLDYSSHTNCRVCQHELSMGVQHLKGASRRLLMNFLCVLCVDASTCCILLSGP